MKIVPFSRLVWFFSALLFLPTAGSDCAADDFSSDFPPKTVRIWPGRDYYSNRLLDWRIRGGRLECVEGSSGKPMRTVHLLTRFLGEGRGTLKMSVRTGPIEASDRQHNNTWTGFLIGVGGEHVDYRSSALCHHWPGEDGGLIAAVDGMGGIVFRDNSHAMGPRGARRDIPLSAWPPIEPVSSKAAKAKWHDVDLVLEAEPGEGGYRLTLAAYDHASGELVSRATVEGIPSQQLTGNVALVSHQSPKQQGAGYWFRDWRVEGTKVVADEKRGFGPVWCAMHTLSAGVLKMTAQMPPLGKQDTQSAELQFCRNGRWETVATGRLIEHSNTIPFRVEDFRVEADTPYRIVYRLRCGPDSTRAHMYRGTIRKLPLDRDEFVVAAFTGHHISERGKGHWNGRHIWYPHNELVAAVRFHRPDFLFFSGDQIYEGGLAGIVREPAERAAVDYLYHWMRWCWAFRDLARDVPTVCVPDDHDVYHGNIWGAGGRHAEPYGIAGQDQGGYVMAPEFVNAVHRTQTSHLPDPVDPAAIKQGISVYFTRIEYANMSFAVIADRMFKSPPAVLLPEGDVRNGWFLNPDFDPAMQADVSDAKLLGSRQLRFLQRWANDWSHQARMKVLLSQTIFANVATVPEGAPNNRPVASADHPPRGTYIAGEKLAADADSNGWPQSGRNRALRAIRRGFAFHIAGDQHLASFIQYGVDDWNDAACALCVPSIANTHARRWYPPRPGRNRKPGDPPYTGEFRDGFGNLVTVRAVANPQQWGPEPAALYDQSPGYGIVRFDRKSRDITVEVWPRWVDPSEPDAEQYPGWPVTVSQMDNYGRKAAAYLPTIEVDGLNEPVVQVIDESSSEPVYTLRIAGRRFRPKVFRRGGYMVRVGEPGTSKLREFRGVESLGKNETATLRIDFE